MKLQFEKAIHHPEWIAPSVTKAISGMKDHDQILAAVINPEWADGEQLSIHYDIPKEMELNCLIVDGSRGEKHTYAALVVPYGKRANTNATVRKPLNAKKVVFASQDYVIKETGMEPGSITPVGLPEDWQILIDSTVFDQKDIIIGSGLLKGKIMMPSEMLKLLKNVEVISGLAKD